MLYKTYIPFSELTLVCFISFFSTGLSAQEQDIDPLQQEFEQALHLREIGKPFDAIRIFESLLISRPELGRTRLELAVSYHQASLIKEALKEFKTVLDDENTPESVKLSIIDYLSRMSTTVKAKPEENIFDIFLLAGYSNDTNITSISGQNSFNPNLINPATPVETSAIEYQLSGQHTIKSLSPLDIAGTTTTIEWQTLAAFSGTNYSGYSDYSFSNTSFSTGPTFYSPGRWRAIIDFKADKFSVGNNDYSQTISINPGIIFDLGYFRGLAVDFTLEKNEYLGAGVTDYDNETRIIELGYTMQFSESKQGIELGIKSGQSIAVLEEYDYNISGLYLGAFLLTSDFSGWFTNISLNHYSFSFPDITTGTTRDDNEYHLSIGYFYDFRSSFLDNWSFKLELKNHNFDSNTDTLDFDRQILEINLSSSF